MIKAILFDLDDTLLDRDATTRVFLTAQVEKRREAFRGVSRERFVELVLKHQRHGYGDKLEAYAAACRELGVKAVSPKTLMEDLQTGYGRTPVVFSGAAETLDTFRAQYALAIVTNGFCSWQQAKLRVSGLGKYFSRVVISEEAGMEKPHRRIFEICCRRMGFRPRECVFVGDHPVNDIAGAKAVGMKTVWKKVAWFQPPEKCDGQIETLPELDPLLAKIQKS
jgi:putative hydrolase of the HAD superfamily